MARRTVAMIFRTRSVFDASKTKKSLRYIEHSPTVRYDESQL